MVPTTQYAILETPSEQTNVKPFNDLKISTKTVMAYPNCSFIVSEHLANMFPINEITPPTAKRAKDIVNPKPGFYQVKSEWGCRGIAPPGTKRAFRNQITVLIYHNDKFCNIKIFPTGKFHMTGCNDKKSYTLAAIKLLNTIRSFHTEQNPTIVQTDEDILEGMYHPKEPLVVAATPTITSIPAPEIISVKTLAKTYDFEEKTGPLEVTEPADPVAIPIAPPKKRGGKRVTTARKNVKNTPQGSPPEKTEEKEEKAEEIISPPVLAEPVEGLSEAESRANRSNRSFSMIFDVVMVNLDFVIGFKVDQINLHDMLLDAAEEEGMYPVYEATTNTSVNIKMTYKDPLSKRYDKYYLNPDIDSENPILHSVFTTYCSKVKPKKSRNHTFLVFSSGKIIQSGSFYDTEMKSAYYRFCQYLIDHRSEIEIGLSTAVFDFSQLRGLNALLAAAANANGGVGSVKKEKIAVLQRVDPEPIPIAV